MSETIYSREMYLTNHPAELFVRTDGNPKADNVLLNLHGGPGFTHQSLIGLHSLASSQLMVVGYDQRGTGRSSTSVPLEGRAGDHINDDFTPLTYAQDVDAVRRAVAGEKKVHLLGHSWGGMVAMQYAIQYPEHVRSLLLIDSVPPTPAGQRAGMEHMSARIGELQQRGIVPMELSTNMVEFLHQILPMYVAETDPPIQIPTEILEFTPEVSDPTWQALGDYDLTEQLATLSIPVQIVFGDTDPFGLGWAEELKAAFTHAHIDYQIIPHCGHLGWIERPEVFFPAVRNFLEQND